MVTDGSPSTKATLGTNAVHVTARFDPRTRTVIALAAIDNLAKGASGGAVQAANVALGLPETSRPVREVAVRAVTEARPHSKAAVLVEALPYIRRFAGSVVVKYGGNALAGTASTSARALRRGIVLMRLVGIAPSSCTAAARRSAP